MRRATLPLLAALFLFTPLAPAQDDSPAGLRRQIDQLNERIAELEAQLDRSKQRVDALTDENRRLRESIATKGPSNTAPRDDATPDEPAELPSDPFASPDSLRAKIQNSWNDEFEGVNVADDAQSRQYLRDIRRWAGKTERDLRGRFTWRAVVVSAREDGRSTLAELQVLDDLGRPIGAPASVEVTGPSARTVLQAAPGAVLEITGNQTVDLDIDARHGDNPDEIGPYIATTIDYNVTTARYE